MISYTRFKGTQLGIDLISVAMAVTPGIFVYQFTGHPWQVDMHVYFYGVLAMIFGFKSERCIIIATAVIVIHHIAISLLHPDGLFPGAHAADWGRLCFHFVMLIIETGFILMQIKNIKRNDAVLAKERENANEALRNAQEQELLRRQQTMDMENRRKAIVMLAADFEGKIREVVKGVQHAVDNMKTVSANISAAVEETDMESMNVAKASEQASNNVQTVATAAELLNTSIREIAGNVADTAQETKTCSNYAEISRETLGELNNAILEIGTVVGSINDVAEQTNLLALNATIEAARAGDAGKGFAVVASEVKSLANETHKMTDNITTKIEQIKSSSTKTIESVNDILDRIKKVDEKTAEVATAIDQQSSSTSEISVNIQQASQSTQEVDESIFGIKEASSKSNKTSVTLRDASEELVRETDNLNNAVEEFLREVQAA